MLRKNELFIDNADLPIVHYRVWSLLDQKRTVLIVFLMMIAIVSAVYLQTGKTHLAIAASILLGLTIWHLWVPMQFEWTTEGVSRWTLGHQRVISWSEIHSYRFQEEGVLILPNRRRYPLDALRGHFIPIPKPYLPAVQRRFRLFVDKTKL